MAEQQNDPVQVFERVTLSVGKLYSVGGLSLLLSGVSASILVLVMIYSVWDSEFAGKIGQNAPMFYVAVLVIGAAGALIGALERFGEYKLATRRMDMMATLTEVLVRSAIPRDGTALTPEGLKAIVNGAYSAVWQNSTLERQGQN